jgi:hypothetical protein
MIRRTRSSSVTPLVLGLAAAALFALHAGPARAAGAIVLPRAGQVGLGIQVQGGSMLSSGALGQEFGGGTGLAVRMRYRMRFERAVGLTFDVQHLKSRDAREHSVDLGSAFDTLGDAPLVLRDKLKLVTAGVEFYQMFDTRSRTVKMISGGFGLAQVAAELTNGETQFPLAGDGVYVSLGGGIERFFFRSLAYDLGTTYMMVLHDGKVNHDVQLRAGIIFYAAY